VCSARGPIAVGGGADEPWMGKRERGPFGILAHGPPPTTVHNRMSLIDT